MVKRPEFGCFRKVDQAGPSDTSRTPPPGAAIALTTCWAGEAPRPAASVGINNNALDPSKTQYLGYDDAQRLTSATGPYGSRSWTYDKVGNRLSETKTVAGVTTTQTYTYPATSNRLAGVTLGSATVRAFTYDAAGNTITDTRSGTAYSYAIDDAGRIAQVSVGSTVNARYTYDYKNRLSVRQTLNMSPAGTTQYLYDASDHLLAETDGAGHVVRQYIWLGDEPIAVLDGSTNPANPTIYYVHADHLQRPELMTDASGAVVWRATYEPFGAVSSVTGAIVENQRLPGQWFQLEAGLAYNWYRHYDATTGRYTTPDPIGRRGGASVYGYAAQSPLMLTDARGLNTPRMTPFDPPPPPAPDPGCDLYTGDPGGDGSGSGSTSGNNNSSDGSPGEASPSGGSPGGDPGSGQAGAESSGSGLSGGQSGSGSPAIKVAEQTCSEFIADNCKGSILREFPSQYLDQPLSNVLQDARRGLDAGKKAKKLLFDNRFRK